MATNYFNIKNGANIQPAASSVAVKGDIGYNSATDKFEAYNGAVDPFVNEAKTATLTNKSIDASTNTLSNIANAAISSSAAIAYSKLNLSGSIVNTDINSSAAIDYSKLNLSGDIVNSDINNAAAIAYSKLNLTGSVVNSDINSAAAIAYSKLNLSGNIVNSDINSAAAIAYSKLNLTGDIVNSDISSSAAIAYSKLNLSGSVNLSSDVTNTLAISHGGTGQATQQAALNALSGTQVSGKYLRSDGTNTSLSSISAGDVPTLNQNTTGSAGSVSGTNVVTNSNLSQMAANTIKGNNTASTANAADLTETQLTAMINQFTSLLQGVVPASGGGTANFLRADGNWSAPTSTHPTSSVWVTAGNGFGSTNTKIRRFTNTVVNTGTDITYADSATNGGSFTINANGVYTIDYMDISSGSCVFGISVNSNQLTSNIQSITNANRLNLLQTASTSQTSLSSTYLATAGDVIRAHGDGNENGTTDNATMFRITRVS